jgi:hypothetical protein
MGSKLKFSRNDWNELLTLAFCGIAVLKELDNGSSWFAAVENAKEAKAIVDCLNKVSATYSDNALIQDIVKDLRYIEQGDFDFELGWFADEQFLKKKIQSANEILENQATPVQSKQFKHFVVKLAYEIASASGDGILGQGQKINPEESAFIEFLKKELL